jgi:hypothetical protein
MFVVGEEPMGGPVARVPIPFKAVRTAAGVAGGFQDLDIEAAFTQQERGGQSGHSGAYDDNLHSILADLRTGTAVWSNILSWALGREISLLNIRKVSGELLVCGSV